jgi:hypothetical protein
VIGSILLLAGQLALPRGDSLAALRAARRAQAEFEGQRRALAPRTPARSGGGCDERIGRFCYWYDDGTSDAPPEPAGIAAARGRLIARLDSAAARIPGDGWVAGQRVRYLVEAGRTDDAVLVARHCGAAAWWCEALEGFARHRARAFAAADSVYAAALDDMPDDVRCRWLDLSAILDGPLARRSRSLSCAARAEFDARVWWLAQPLYARPGNDRRTEHWARLTMARLLAEAASAWQLAPGADLSELIVRYGWPEAWSQGPLEPGAAAPMIVGHERQPSYHFVPDLLPAADTTPPSPQSWTLQPLLTRERYAPAYATRFEAVAPDFSVLRRGESTLVVVAYDLTQDTLFAGRRIDAALALATDERSPVALQRRPAAPPAGAIVAAAPGTTRVASFEVTADSDSRAARARIGVVPWVGDRSGLALSDLVIFEPADSLPPSADLSDVLPLVHGPARARQGGRIGLYWEAYGVDSGGENLTAQVAVAPTGSGLLRRVGAWLRMGHRPRETLLEWQETGRPREGAVCRALVVNVATLPPGRYRIELTVASSHGERRTARHDLEIRSSHP